MATTEEILARVNQQIAEIRSRVGTTTGSQTGTEGRDRFFGSFGDDEILGLGGDDLISGNLGNDYLDGGSGNDFIDGGFGNDYLVGGDGNDRLFGKLGDDLVFGGAGNDLMDGSVGSDVLFGGDGNDNITGGTNGDPDAPEGFFEDYLVGGNGNDTLNGFGNGRGTFEVDVLIGGGEVDANGNIVDFSPDGVRDVFVLGNANGAFYTQAGFDDYALIFDFEPGIDQIQLGSVPNPQLATESLFSDVDTLIFSDDTFSDLVAVVVGVDLT
jgi:RTX calcium-binding nonapeptide repeat (4 copies)